MKTTPKLFIGLGHVLRRDDGLGVRAAEVMASLSLPADVEVFDAGLGGWGLADVIERRDLVVVADAIDAGDEPGAIYRCPPDSLTPNVRGTLSLHDVHLLEALEKTRALGTAPQRVVILAVQIGDDSTGIGLTPAVERALDHVLVLGLRELGVPETVLDEARTATTSSSSS
jgi:hydrogenase maturation protease